MRPAHLPFRTVIEERTTMRDAMWCARNLARYRGTDHGR